MRELWEHIGIRGRTMGAHRGTWKNYGSTKEYARELWEHIGVRESSIWRLFHGGWSETRVFYGNHRGE